MKKYEDLVFKKKNASEFYSKEERWEINSYAEGYIEFLNRAKTEREAVKYQCFRIKASKSTGWETK